MFKLIFFLRFYLQIYLLPLPILLKTYSIIYSLNSPAAGFETQNFPPFSKKKTKKIFKNYLSVSLNCFITGCHAPLLFGTGCQSKAGTGEYLHAQGVEQTQPCGPTGKGLLCFCGQKKWVCGFSFMLAEYRGDGLNSQSTFSYQ